MNEKLPQELEEALETFLKQQNRTKKHDKICFMFADTNNQFRPTLACFRKIKESNEMKIQVLHSSNPQAFQDIIHSIDSKDWVDMPHSKTTPMLRDMLTVKEPQKREPVGEYIQRLTRPHRSFFTRYYQNWTNGKHLQLLNKYIESVKSGYPMTLLEKCFQKWRSWTG